MKIVLPLPPSSNRYWRNCRGRTFVSAEAKAFKQEVALLCATARVRPVEGACGVSMDVYRARRSGDLDNKIKCTLDSLNKIAFNDDSQIVEIKARRFDDKANPRVEIEVYEVAA